MKYYNLLICLIIVMNSFSQDSKIFDETYFINTVSDLLNDNIDSVKIYSKNESVGDDPNLIVSYTFKKEKNKLVVKRLKQNVLLIDGRRMNSIQIFYLGDNLAIDSIHKYGVQDGVFLVNTTNRKIIDYEEGAIKSITLIENNYSDTTVTSFNYFGNLAWKVNIRSSRNQQDKKITINDVFYIEYYREGKVLKEIGE